MFMKTFYFILLFSTYFHFSSNCQYGINYNSDEALESYTLFETSSATYLIDNCGEILNEWPVVFTDNHSKLLPNGNIIYIQNNQVIEMNFNGVITKRTSTSESDLMLNYEVIVLENGNYLCLARRIRTSSFFTQNGYNPSLGTPSYDDAVVEIVPVTGQIVWEWNISDHVIQERSSSLNNYGEINQNPRLLNLDAISTYDWTRDETFMLNGMDYNAELDQIVISVRKIGEIAIIDHSTTTQEAKGSTGGRYGHGGDILYRWGNPQNYGFGDESDQMLYYQHNPNWIEYGEHKGKIIIHNNGLNRPGTSFGNRYSEAMIVNPLQDGNGNYTLVDDKIFHPIQEDFSYNRFTTNTQWYSSYTSSAKVLPNGNIYITEGDDDHFFEINPAGETVWEYSNQFGTYIFRSEKYPVSYEGFQGLNFVPNGTVEEPSSNYNCTLFSTSTNDVNQNKININVSQSFDNFIIENNENVPFYIHISDMLGRAFYKSGKMNDNFIVSKNGLPSGIYLISIFNKNRSLINTQKIFIK